MHVEASRTQSAGRFEVMLIDTRSVLITSISCPRARAASQMRRWL